MSARLVAVVLTLALAHLADGDAVVFSTIDPNTSTYSFPSGVGLQNPILNHPAGSPPGVYQSYVDQFTPATTSNFRRSSSLSVRLPETSGI